MRLVYAIRHVGMTGGVKVFFQHVELLRGLGHEIHLIARFIDEEWSFPIKPEIVSSFEDTNIPDADGIVVTTPKDVEELWPVASKRGIPLFHFLQGFEPDYVLERINGAVIPARFRGKSLLKRLKYRWKILEWKKRLERFDRLYKLPTIKIAIAPHLVQGVKKRFNIPCYHLPNGINKKVFYPKEKELDYSSVPLKILSVGNYNIEYKAIADIHEAVRILKKGGRDIYFTRVSPADIPEEEKKSGVVDRFFVRISEAQIADLYRESHMLISASTEIEGFGLPPVEAMSTRTPVILTKISPFLSFDADHDYAYFVNVHRPEELAEGVVSIAEDRVMRKGFITRGLEVSEKYSLEVVGKNLVEILKNHVVERGV